MTHFPLTSSVNLPFWNVGLVFTPKKVVHCLKIQLLLKQIEYFHYISSVKHTFMTHLSNFNLNLPFCSIKLVFTTKMTVKFNFSTYF